MARDDLASASAAKDAMHRWQATLGVVSDLGLGVGQVWFMRQGGLLAAISVRLGYYAVWQVLYGVMQGAS